MYFLRFSYIFVYGDSVGPRWRQDSKRRPLDGSREREKEREREREREKKKQRKREREKKTDRATKKQRNREREKELRVRSLGLRAQS